MKKRNSALVAAVASLLVVASCGSDDPASDGGSSGTSGASATTQAGAATSEGGATTVAGTGGSGAAGAGKADDSLPPVVVGFHNLEGGALSLPEIREGFEAGVKYVNEELGGINGRPLEVDVCELDVTPESSVNCANRFVEAGVVAAVQGVDVAADAALPILQQAGIVEIGFFAFSPAMNSAVGDAYFTLVSHEEGYAADMKMQKTLGASSMAVVQADLPSAHAVFEDVYTPTSERVGIEVQDFYYPSQADWTTLAATILASSPDAVSLPAAEDSVCLAAVPALRAAGFTGVIHASSCSQIIDDLSPEELENTISHNEFYYETFTEIPAKPARDLEIFRKYMPEVDSLVYAQLGFADAVDVADDAAAGRG